MISHAPDHLLFIEPTRPASAVPVIDALTRRMTGAWRERATSLVAYDGVHMCTACSSTSDSEDHFVITTDGRELLTNSLAIHYLAYHRDEVPAAELAKVASLAAEMWEPTVDEMIGER
jgi:hypothetical protein